MATFYCIHGATNNGDGTTSDEAVSDGGVGAFNDAIAIFNGSNAAITNPCTVIFKTNHLGLDITIVLSTLLQMVGGDSYANSRTYIFDDGTTWVSEGGVFTLEFTASRVDTDYYQRYSIIALKPYGFVLNHNYQTSVPINHIFGDGIYKNIHWKIGEPYNTATSVRKWINTYFSRYGRSTVISCKKDYVEDGNGTLGSLNGELSLTAVTVNGLQIDLYHRGTGFGKTFLGSYVTDARNVYINAIDTPTESHTLCVNHVTGVTYPATLDLVYDATDVVKIGSNSLFDFRSENREGVFIEAKSASNYPVLNALSVDAATLWSIKVDTAGLIDSTHAEIYNHVKYYDLASGAKNIRVNILIPDSFVTPKANQWWMIVSVTKLDGTVELFDTYSLQNLTEDVGAGWSTVVYSSITYKKYYFEVAASDIKQYSNVNVAISTDRPPINANEFYFIDPEVVLS